MPDSSEMRRADGMAGASAVGDGAASAAGAGAGSRGGLGRFGFRRGGSWRRRSAGFAFGDGAQERAHLHGGAGLGIDRFNRAIGGRGHFHRDLVGLQLQQRLVPLHRIAFLLEPFGDGGFGDGLAHRGHFDFDGHMWLLK